MNIFSLLKEEELKINIELGMISARPYHGVVVYNYTPKAANEREWNSCTMACRGLITDEKGWILARPFTKFFNLGEEKRPIPQGLPLVFDKMDGCLGIAYRHNGTTMISTRGSASSEQAVAATKFLHDNYPGWEPPAGFTYLFEVCLPESRIVLDYSGKYGLYLIGIRHIDGTEYVVSNKDSNDWPGTVVESFPPGDIDFYSKIKRDNAEGFVLLWNKPHLLSDGFFRLKIKQEDYLIMHRAMISLTPKNILELMEQGLYEDYRVNLPLSLRPVADSYQADFSGQYIRIRAEAVGMVDKGHALRYTRKQFGLTTAGHKYAAVVFAILDGRSVNDIKKIIFKIIRRSY